MFYLGMAPAPHFEMHVVGAPAPQGSKVPGGRTKEGRITMRESSKRVAPWRSDVTDVALDIVSPDKGVSLLEGYPLEGPLVGYMVFTMKKPTAAPKRRRTYAATKGNDSSKLVRSTEDALVKVRAIDDDGLIIEYLRIAKVFPGEDVDALAMPGAVIRFWAVNRLPELGS
jgi:crossover junction endodeoxyribonuclease RusA